MVGEVGCVKIHLFILFSGSGLSWSLLLLFCSVILLLLLVVLGCLLTL